LVSLTKEGSTRAEGVQAALDGLEAEIGARTNPQDLDGFYRVLTAIADVTDVAVTDDREGAGWETREEENA
jgi:hypothetical protein